jgi:acyl-CoA oxidase
MSGINTGDLGPKIGYFSKDNGWMTMKDVRVPRNQLMQRYIEVSREGEVNIVGDKRNLYSVMVDTRLWIIGMLPRVAMICLLIGLRYSAVRRQFKNISGQREEV